MREPFLSFATCLALPGPRSSSILSSRTSAIKVFAGPSPTGFVSELLQVSGGGLTNASCGVRWDDVESTLLAALARPSWLPGGNLFGCRTSGGPSTVSSFTTRGGDTRVLAGGEAWMGVRVNCRGGGRGGGEGSSLGRSSIIWGRCGGANILVGSAEMG